jgi:dipeptidyl aminopeptidase/acylaminoacyl peptidase
MDASSVVFFQLGNPKLCEGSLIQPKNAAAKSLPVLVYNRGGNGPTGQLIFWGTIFKQLMPLAAQGDVVFASNYRGNHNPMKLPPEHTGKDEFGGADAPMYWHLNRC